ncbi:MAG: CCA tRNA nucleotidyltransferase [Candidatus Nitrosocaldaceae archaeon]
MKIDELIRLAEPSEEEHKRVDLIAMTSIELVRNAAKEFSEVKEVIFGGSYAKDTWIRNDNDIDIFVKIDKDTDKQRFEYIGKRIGLLALRNHSPYLRYAQHPYVEAVIDGVKVNIVPCYDVEKGAWKSAADRSIYHTLFINKHLTLEMKREVRILKQFMKMIGVYGAEISINGFSGYVCEVLILKYGSFVNLLENARRFKDREVISIVEYDKSIIDAFNSRLIILDPVDVRRNLGAAISDTNVAKFILASRIFLRDPNLLLRKRLVNRDLNNLIVIMFGYEKRSEDIIWGQVKHTLNAIIKQLESNDFKVIRSACYINTHITFVLLLDSLLLSKYNVRKGPEVFNEDHLNRFLASNKDAEMLWIDGVRVYCLRRRIYDNALTFLNDLLTKNIEKSGISRGLIDDIKKGFKIYSYNELYNLEIVDDVRSTDILL